MNAWNARRRNGAVLCKPSGAASRWQKAVVPSITRKTKMVFIEDLNASVIYTVAGGCGSSPPAKQQERPGRIFFSRKSGASSAPLPPLYGGRGATAQGQASKRVLRAVSVEPAVQLCSSTAAQADPLQGVRASATTLEAQAEKLGKGFPPSLTRPPRVLLNSV